MSEEGVMSEDRTRSTTGKPWHLWFLGILAVLWNGMGALDYLMTETRNEAYMSRFTPEQLEYFYGFPAWLVAFWAIAVWGGLLGAGLLLFRKRLAVPVFLVSFLAMVVTTLYNYVLSNGLEAAGDTFSLVFSGVIFVVALLLLLYSKAMRARGVLT